MKPLKIIAEILLCVLALPVGLIIGIVLGFGIVIDTIHGLIWDWR